MIVLDALYPPAPDQLVADCRALGAGGCWAYVLRRAADGTDIGVGNWTPAHVDALHRAGLWSGGIVVPGDVPPPAQAAIDALRAMHCDPVLASDLEQFSLPPTWWEDQLEGLEGAEGVRGIDYGTLATLSAYDPGQPNWVAEWLRRGVLDPLPPLPAGRRAWQFVDDVPLPSGAQADVSVVDPALLEGTMDPTARGWLERLALELGIGPLAGDDPNVALIPGDGPTPGGVADLLLRRTADLVARPPVDPAAVAAALAADPAFVRALADALAHRLGVVLSAA